MYRLVATIHEEGNFFARFRINHDNHWYEYSGDGLARPVRAAASAAAAAAASWLSSSATSCFYHRIIES